MKISTSLNEFSRYESGTTDNEFLKKMLRVCQQGVVYYKFAVLVNNSERSLKQAVACNVKYDLDYSKLCQIFVG